MFGPLAQINLGSILAFYHIKTGARLAWHCFYLQLKSLRVSSLKRFLVFFFHHFPHLSFSEVPVSPSVSVFNSWAVVGLTASKVLQENLTEFCPIFITAADQPTTDSQTLQSNLDNRQIRACLHCIHLQIHYA